MRVIRQAAKQLVGSRAPKANGSGEDMNWISASVVEGFRDAVSRRIPMLVMYSTEEVLLKDFDLAKKGPLGAVLEQAGSTVTVRTMGGPIRILSNIPVQEELMHEIIGWVDASVPASAVGR